MLVFKGKTNKQIMNSFLVISKRQFSTSMRIRKTTCWCSSMCIQNDILKLFLIRLKKNTYDNQRKLRILYRMIKYCTLLAYASVKQIGFFCIYIIIAYNVASFFLSSCSRLRSVPVLTSVNYGFTQGIVGLLRYNKYWTWEIVIRW